MKNLPSCWSLKSVMARAQNKVPKTVVNRMTESTQRGVGLGQHHSHSARCQACTAGHILRSRLSVRSVLWALEIVGCA